MLAHPVSSASGSGPDSLAGPDDLAARPLQIDDEVDGLADHRPHFFGEPTVVGAQHVMPDAGCDVGAEVAVAVGILDRRRCAAGSATIRRPAGWSCTSRTPRVRAPPARRPSAPSRSRRDPTDRCGRLRTTEWRRRTPGCSQSISPSACTVQASGHRARRERQVPAPDTSGFWKYNATLLPISGLSSDSAVRVSHGRLTMSQTNSLW